MRMGILKKRVGDNALKARMAPEYLGGGWTPERPEACPGRASGEHTGSLGGAPVVVGGGGEIENRLKKKRVDKKGRIAGNGESGFRSSP